jgi:hypothetical protein
MSTHSIYSDNYNSRLFPFFVVSIIAHAIIISLSLAISSSAFSKNTLSVTKFLAGTDSSTEKKHGSPQAGDDQIKTRQKIFRVDYINTLRLDIPVSAVIKPSPAVVKKPLDVNPVVKPVPVKPVNTDDSIPKVDSTEIKPIGKVLTKEELETNGQTLKFPPFTFKDIPYNENKWQTFSSFSCRGYDILYFIVDISKKDGFEEYFEWATFWDYLFSIEGVADPPTPIGIAEIIEDPYFLTPDMASDALRMRIEKLDYKIPTYKNYNFLDVDGQVLNQLEIQELENPRIYLVDRDGYVRLLLEGRIADVPIMDINKAVGAIAELWGMTNVETALATAAVISYQQKLVDEQKASKTP